MAIKPGLDLVILKNYATIYPILWPYYYTAYLFTKMIDLQLNLTFNCFFAIQSENY